MLDWEEGDRFSFEDSDRFEEDSLCSWSSEPESLCNNWRGWKRPAYSNGNYSFGANKNRSPEDGSSNKSSSGSPPNPAAPSTSSSGGSSVASLTELCARCVASHIPFELVERVFPPVPEQLQLRIAFWSFPDNEEDIRLYSCLANGSADEFQRGDNLFRIRAVKDPLQIGFHLSATVHSVQPRGQFNVAVTFDRRRISSCNCTCTSLAYWCSHIVAVCLHRIHCPNQVCLRAPVSESLQQLQRDQLQKFAQYLISELPQQILPTAQRLLDELLSSQPTKINTVCGAPDPTAGASASDQTSWYLDTKTLHDNIKKILIKFCVPAPIVFSDVNYLSTTAPPAAAEWSSLLRPLRGREPEGMWNLLSIVREMFKRTDRNAIPLLEIITEECMACDQILVWWFSTRVALMSAVSGGGGSHGGGGGHSGRGGGQSSNSNGGAHSNAHASQHACSSLCDEIVVLWRLAAQNPALAPKEREMLKAQFIKWHLKILDKVLKARGSSGTTTTSTHKLSASHHHNNGHHHNHHHHHHHHTSSGSGGRPLSDLEVFTGFKPAIEACHLDWDDYPIPGVTHSADTNPVYHCPFTCFKKTLDSGKGDINQVNSSQVVLSNQHPQDHYRHNHPKSLGRMDLQQWRHQPCNAFRGFSEVRPSHATASTSGTNVSTGCSSNAAISGLTTSAPSTSVSLHQRYHHQTDGNRSSVSSEGFCENDDGTDSPGCGVTTNNESAVTSGSSSSVNNSSDTNSSASCERGTRVLKTRENLMKTLDRSGGGGSSSDDSDSNKRYGRPVPSTSGAGSNHSNKSAGSSSKDESDNNSNNKHNPELTRRDSKDDSVSSSESQLSGDEYSHYYYDPKALQSVQSTAGNSKDKTMDQQLIDIFNNIKISDDSWEILFARAEGLHAHGHGREACILGVKLAEELLANPPDLMVEIPQIQRKKGKKHHVNPASHQLSVLASATLAKCAFLCTVLAENQEHSHLAFKVGLFGLELPRPPASTKPLEVKLANQESDLVNLLKRITLGPAELSITRERAEQLKEGTLRSRGEALLPIMLASFIFEALVVPSNGKSKTSYPRLPTDEALGFEAAVAALGIKANVSEADHPLLCEGTRRQRGDLALVLLNHYKQEPNKIARIMDKLLDRDIHQLIKTPILSSYYSSNPPIRSRLFSLRQRDEHNDQFVPHMYSWEMQQLPQQPSRPHSSTSAELDNVGMCNLSISGTSAPTNQVTTGQITSTRSKESRYKGKRAYPSIPNQPSEASAHFMFELAKSVLTKAGGNSSTSLFTQASTTQNHHGPHRALHMCAFQLGLYALGLHNCVSSNWLSRTYSSHVSWITGQAMEIGAPAISFLIDTWEGHLTPPEAVTIADRASQNCDANMVRAAAELALSCLPHAQALNPNEIQRAILQCKEQSDVMLERACVTVENVAKGGGVYPEVLFQVARYWYDLYVVLAPGDGPHQCHAPPPEEVMCAGVGPNGADGLVALVMDPAQQELMPMGQLQQQPPPSLVTTSAPAVSSQQQQQQLVAQTMPLQMQPASSGLGQQPIPVSVVQQQQQQQQQVVVNQVSLPLPLPLPVPPPSQQGNQGGNAGVPGAVVVTGAPPMPPPGTHMQYAPNAGGVTPYAAAAAAALYHHPQLAAAVAAHHHHQQQQQHQQQQHQQHQLALHHHHHQQHQQHHVAFLPHQQQQPPQAPPQVYHLQQARQFQYPPPPIQQYVPPIQYYSTPVLRPALPYQPQQPGQPQGAPGLLSLPSLPPPPTPQSLRPSQMPGAQQQGSVSNNRVRGNGLNPSNVPPPQYPHAQLRHLLAAYRVGMLALETLARRVHDDRPQAKYARNPPYGEDVKWLLRVSKRLGTQYIQQFCVCVVNSIVSPFVLHEVAMEAAHYLARNNPGLIMQHLRSALTPLVQKCQQMYIQCMHQKLYHLTLDDYEDFVNVVCAARQAFYITPEGSAQFKEWLQSIRRSKSCKKDLWTQINAALQANGGK